MSQRETSSFSTAWKELLALDRILIVPHINPDGDAIGSGLGLYWSLKKLGKKVYLYNKTQPLPYFLDFLPGFEKISNRLPVEIDGVVSVDCADFSRTGLPERPKILINIDHHQSNPDFGDINLVDRGGPATAQVVYQLLKINRAPLPVESATALYTGILTDTGNFQFDTVTAQLFRDVSELVELGAEPATIAKKLYQRGRLSRLRILSKIYNTLRLYANGKVAMAYVTQEMYRETGADRDDTESVVNELRNLNSVEVGVFLREEEDGGVKISLRSKEQIDVSQIALQLGGGGHIRAAGVTLPNTTIEKAWKTVYAILKSFL